MMETNKKTVFSVHGAGRTLGRKAAIRELDLETEKKAMNDRGIIHSIRKKMT